MSSIMEGLGQPATTKEDELAQLTPEELAVFNRIAKSPSIPGMSDIEYAKAMTQFYKDMDQEELEMFGE